MHSNLKPTNEFIMKKFFAWGVIALIFFSSCEECPPPRFTTSSPEIDNSMSLVQDYLSGDWDAWLTRYAEGAKLSHNATTGLTPEEAADDLKQLITYFSEYSFDEDVRFYEMVTDDEGKTWVYFWSDWKGNFKDSDETLTVPVHLAQRYEDGKVVEEYGYYDLSVLMAKLAEFEAAASAADEEGGEE